MSACTLHTYHPNNGSEKPASLKSVVCGGMNAPLLNSFNSRIGTMHSVVIPQVSITVL
jgi:hypothetical protein